MKLISLPGFEVKSSQINWCAAKGPFYIICSRLLVVP